MPWMFRFTKTGTLVGAYGRADWRSGFPGSHGWRDCNHSQRPYLQPVGRVDCGEHGCGAGHRSRVDPKSVAGGHDPQLERAVTISLEQLKKNDYQHSSSAKGSEAGRATQ